MGKTTMIDELARRGYATIPEAARQIIQEEQQKQCGVLPWTDLVGFQYAVLKRQSDLERSIEQAEEEVVFLDRAIDGIAYCRLNNVKVPDVLLSFAQKNRYDGVFVLDQLPYKQDAERREDEVFAAKIHVFIKEAYVDAGYALIEVPVLSVKDRVEYVLKRVGV